MSTPTSRVKVIVRDRFMNPVAEGVDVTIRPGTLSDSGLVARKLMDVHLVLGASKDYLRKRGVPKTVDDLSQHLAVTVSADQPYVVLVDEDGEQHPFHANSRLEVGDGRAALDAMSLGLGVGVVSVRALKRRPELQRILPNFRVPPRPLLAVYPSAMRRSTRIRAVVDHLAQSLRPVMS